MNKSDTENISTISRKDLTPSEDLSPIAWCNTSCPMMIIMSKAIMSCQNILYIKANFVFAVSKNISNFAALNPLFYRVQRYKQTMIHAMISHYLFSIV